MGRLRIYCGNCKNYWEVYSRDDWKSWRARTCPVCSAEVNSSIWEENILKGFGELEDGNRELLKEISRDDDSPAGFGVSYIEDSGYLRKRRYGR